MALDYATNEDERHAVALIAGPGARLTGRFGPRAQVPGTKSRPHHDGIDIAGAAVGAKVLMHTPRDFQTILYSGKDSYGALDLFLGTKQDGLRFVHNSEHAVTKGPVARGQVVARMGATGNVNGVHTHLERYEGGRVVDPLPWLISLLDRKNTNPLPDTPATNQEDDEMAMSEAEKDILLGAVGRIEKNLYALTKRVIKIEGSGDTATWALTHEEQGLRHNLAKVQVALAQLPQVKVEPTRLDDAFIDRIAGRVADEQAERLRD